VPEAYRSLIVIVFCALVLFRFYRGGIAPLFPAAEYGRFRNLWLALTLLAFISGSFWIFAATAVIALQFAASRSGCPPAIFPGILLCLPASGMDIPGFGLVNYVFTLTVPRLFALLLLLPAALTLLGSGRRPMHARWPDRIFSAYVVLEMALAARQESLTNALRMVFLVFLDVVLPYFVLSRALLSPATLRQALAGMLAGALVLAGVAAVEFTKQWLLYSSLGRSWGMKEAVSSYLGRSGMLRVRASSGHAIALGFVMLVAWSALLAFWPVLTRFWRRAAGVALACGLFFPVSRGPWLGAAALICVYVATGPAALSGLVRVAAGALLLAAAAALLPGGERVVGLLPFVGHVDRGSIDYREKLLHESVKLLAEHPVLGPPAYMERLANAGLVQGEGIVDIVNSYVGIALNSGLAGLGLFAAFFLSILLALRSTSGQAKSLPVDSVFLHTLARGLTAGLAGMLVTIATVSSVSIIPWLYWSYAGLCVACIRVVQALSDDARREPQRQVWKSESRCLETASTSLYLGVPRFRGSLVSPQYPYRP
jgi:hypothetical protein